MASWQRMGDEGPDEAPCGNKGERTEKNSRASQPRGRGFNSACYHHENADEDIPRSDRELLP
jgi:hypothetical protein